jgi:hypothetical protein
MEGLLYTDPNNLDLLGSLIKAYAGLGYGVHETIYLEDFYNQAEDSKHLRNAIKSYKRSLGYGLRFLKLIGLDWEQLKLQLNDQETLMNRLKSQVGLEHREALFFLANAWGGLINLQKKNIRLISTLPFVKAMYDYICTQDPTYHGGSCEIFYGVYESARPKMLGGNPVKGQKHFEKVVELYSFNLLGRINYIQYSLIPSFNQDEFQKQMQYLEDTYNKFRASELEVTWGEAHNKYPEVNLYNAIAFKRFLILQKMKTKLF